MANGSRSRKTKGGSGGGIAGFIFAILLAGALVAFFNIPVNPSVKGIWNTLKERSNQVEVWAKNIGQGNFNFTIPEAPAPGTITVPEAPGSSTTSTGTKAAMLDKLNTIVVADAANVSYNRADWYHWANITPCWTTREQVLFDEAVNGEVTILDINKVPTTDVNAACYVTGGKWFSAYDGQTFTNPEDLDIDHMIPLNYAAQHGGQDWGSDKKADYANNREYAGHLNAVSANSNRSKSDQGPSKWKPSRQEDWCVYATDWVNISATWSLTVTKDDKNALTEMLNKCAA